jgi:predicted DCC family thiol-disulfide oxidoreductase YuxK
MADDSSNPIILYDGVCGLCNRLVQFVLKRDARDRFRFAALLSQFAAGILGKFGADPRDLDTVYVVLNHGHPDARLAARSDAIVLILRELGGVWKFLSFPLWLLPRWLRDWGYNLVARYRYRIFGKYDSCPLPQEKDKRKFLDSV